MKRAGFVLSFALFILALYILVYAQLQSSHLQALNVSEGKGWQLFSSSRLAWDLTLDLNTLLDQHLSLDQNVSDVSLFMHGSLPSDLNRYTNLLRYQSNAVQLGRDYNLFVQLDLNRFAQDLNLVGRTDHNMVWKEPVSSRRISWYSERSQVIPTRIDINVIADRDYNRLAAWTLIGSGNTYIRFFYQDTNSNHDFTSEGWARSSTAYNYFIDFNTIPSSRLSVTYGPIDGNNGSFRIDNNNTSNLRVDYKIRIQMTADANATRAGYDLPLTIRGNDINVIQSTQWIYD